MKEMKLIFITSSALKQVSIQLKETIVFFFFQRTCTSLH